MNSPQNWNPNAPALAATPDTFAYIRDALGIPPEMLGRSYIPQAQSPAIPVGTTAQQLNIKFQADFVALGFVASPSTGADIDYASLFVRIQFGTTEDFFTDGNGGATDGPLASFIGRGSYRPGFYFPRPRLAKANESWIITFRTITGATTNLQANLGVVGIELLQNIPR